jgi:hypothetical protein
MTEADVERARVELGIGRVVDLRGKRSGGSGLLGASGRGVIMSFFRLAGGMDRVDKTPDGFLSSLLDVGASPLGAFFQYFVETDEAVLVHCHTGKDRTGFVVAMTLALVGVADDDIVTDYVRTVPVFETLMANLAHAGYAVRTVAPSFARHAPSEEGMVAMLARLRAEWSSPEAWAHDQGIEPELIERVRARLLEP